MKNISAKACMLIGLLGLSPLFSCTSTRQAMGSYRDQCGLTQGNCKRWYNRNPIRATCCLGIGVGVATVFTGLGTYYWPSGSGIPSNHSTTSTTVAPYTSPTTESYPSSTTESFNPTWRNSNGSTGSDLAYKRQLPSSATAPNKNRSNRSVYEA